MIDPTKTVNRKYAVRAARPDLHTVPREAPTNLSRKAEVLARVELMNEALSRLIELAYERLEDQYINIDPITYRLLVPVPWGRRGHRFWGLRASEAVVLRNLLMTRELTREQSNLTWPALFSYDPEPRNWYVNVSTYPSSAEAFTWLKRSGKVSAGEWTRAQAVVKGGVTYDL